jgi:glycosyltransferase involved in cell wall biosynthesis
MVVAHIASTLTGGAGIGMQRYHEAMLVAGLDSRIVVGSGSASADSRIARCHRQPASLVRRVARRVGIQLDPAARRLSEVEELDAAAGGHAGYELFSPPFSDCIPEEHPWVKQADVLNLHWVAGTVDWPRFFRKVSKPVIITLHDQQPYLGGFHYARDLDNNPHLQRVEAHARGVKQAALAGHRVTVVGNSEWNTREAQASGFFPTGTRYHTLYYPLDTQVYAPWPKQAARAALGLPPARTVIGFASEDLGNRRKGFDVLLEALQRLPASLTTQCCILSFGREPAQELKDRVPMPGLHLGHLDSDAVKVAAYSAMDLFVAPSLAEAFGLTAIEALACGTPAIASRTGGLAEALFGGDGGVLVEPGNPTALVEALISSLEHSERRATLAGAGRRLLVERHAPARVGQHWLEICRASLA